MPSGAVRIEPLRPAHGIVLVDLLFDLCRILRNLLPVGYNPGSCSLDIRDLSCAFLLHSGFLGCARGIYRLHLCCAGRFYRRLLGDSSGFYRFLLGSPSAVYGLGLCCPSRFYQPDLFCSLCGDLPDYSFCVQIQIVHDLLDVLLCIFL